MLESGFWWIVLRLFLIFTSILAILIGILTFQLQHALLGILILLVVLLIEDIRR